MKTCEEKAQSALKRIHEQKEIQKKRKKFAAKVLTPVVSFSLAALIGTGVWQSGMLKQASVPIQESPGTESSDKNAGQEKDDTVYTDSVVLPEKHDAMMADMLGCLVYKGSVYTQSTSCDNMSGIEHLVGDYIGEAKGILEEWSSQKDWSTEFASTYSGPVYTVKGYSEDFRLCVCLEAGDTKWIQFLDNYDGIGLSTGKDLFEDRLHLKNNVVSAAFLTHDDWDHGNPYHYQPLEKITEEELDEFIDLLCDSPFERIEYQENPNFYDAEVQGHLYLKMSDGTQVALRLIDGGYVGCQDLGWVFVKMPGKLFDAVLSACQ